jgi:hypothetical protein
MPPWIHAQAEKQEFVMALLASLQLTSQSAEALLRRGNWLTQEVESFFAPMAGNLLVSDAQVRELERFIDELEAPGEELVPGTPIRGERAIEFCAGWGRLRIYVIRDRFDGVDLLDWDAGILETGERIIASLER